MKERVSEEEKQHSVKVTRWGGAWHNWGKTKAGKRVQMVEQDEVRQVDQLTREGREAFVQ